MKPRTGRTPSLLSTGAPITPENATLLLWIAVVVVVGLPLLAALSTMALSRIRWGGIARRNGLTLTPWLSGPRLIGTDPFGFSVEVVINRAVLLRFNHQAMLPDGFLLTARGMQSGGGTENPVLDMMVRVKNGQHLPWAHEDLMASVLEFLSLYPDSRVTNTAILVQLDRKQGPKLSRHLYRARKLAQSLKEATAHDPTGSPSATPTVSARCADRSGPEPC